MKRTLAAWSICVGLLLGSMGAALAGTSYTDNGNGTVTDPGTGLIWMRCAMGQAWTENTCIGTTSTYNWDQAAALTGTTNFAGQNDWRLPNILELQSIVDRSVSSPAINAAAFPATPSSGIWSSTPSAGNSANAWYVYFGTSTIDGSAYLNPKTNSFAVRMLRGGQSPIFSSLGRPDSAFVDNGDGTVTHTATGLMWKRCIEGSAWDGATCSTVGAAGGAANMTWDAAKLLAVTFAGKSDWRLATQDELLTLVDYTRASPALNTTMFPTTPPFSYVYSSTPDVRSAGSGWGVYFERGDVYSTSGGFQVRLVRGGAVSPTSTTATTTTTIAGSTTTTLINSGASVAPMVVAGENYTVALKSDGTVWSWGINDSQQLGNGGSSNISTPVPVSGLSGVNSIAAGYYHTLAVKSDGTLWAWGNGGAGQLGNASATSSAMPIQVPGLGSVAMAAGGANHSVALKTDGSVWSWGSNALGQLGTGIAGIATAPAQVPGLTGVTAVAAGGNHTLALKSDGTVWAWGYNSLGQLGNGVWTGATYTAGATAPIQVQGLTGVTAIAAGWEQSAALKADGSIWTWGSNRNGELGGSSASANNSSLAAPIPTLTGVRQVSIGSFHMAAYGSNGAVWTWGNNGYGQLGNGGTSNSGVPFQVPGIGNAISVAAGKGMVAVRSDGTSANHTVAVEADGTVWAWGANMYGQLGTGQMSTAEVTAPVQASINLLAGTGGTTSSTTSTTTSSTTTTIAGTTTTTLTGSLSYPLSLIQGWNLVGNSLNLTFRVDSLYGDANSVTTVWKWSAGQSLWQFYTPSMDAATLQSYATSKGYHVLTWIGPGEGYWVNAKIALSLATQSGTALDLGASDLQNGWNLVATGNDVTPSAFNISLSTTAPGAGVIPGNLLSLWAWNNTASAWYFYAPSLDAQGGTKLTDYITSKGYLDFTQNNKKLGNGTGFWANKP